MIKIAAICVILFLFSGCSTNVSGIVTNTAKQPLSDVKVVMVSANETATTKTNQKGYYYLSIKEFCVIICAGGAPDITYSKQGYKTAVKYTSTAASKRIDVVLKDK